MKFLYGLKYNLEEVWGRFMSIRPLPKLRSAFTEVRREESGKQAMSLKNSHPGESLALLAKGGFNLQMSGRPWYDRYRKSGHTRDTC